MKPRTRRFLILSAASVGLAATVFISVRSEQQTAKLSMATAYSSLALLGLSLTIGPYNVLRRRPNPVSTHLRRDIGILAAIIGGLHVVFGFQVHFGGRIMSYLINPDDGTWRRDPMGLANYTGIAALLILTVLLTLSNDVSLRRFGTRRWKSLQRWNYGLIFLVAGHGAIYQLLEKRVLPFVAIFVISLVVIATLQWKGFRRTRETLQPPG